MSDTRHFPNPSLKVHAFEQQCVRQGWLTDHQKAQGLGISRAQLSKVINERGHPGARFIHATMCVFDCPYEELYGDAEEPR